MNSDFQVHAGHQWHTAVPRIEYQTLGYQPFWRVRGHKKDASVEEPWVTCLFPPRASPSDLVNAIFHAFKSREASLEQCHPIIHYPTSMFII